MIYFDNSATTRVLPQAIAAAEQAMGENFFNPSGAYGGAALVEKQVEAARSRLARPLGAANEEILFTSGGTESNNMAIRGTLQTWRGPCRILISAVEHPSVYETALSMADGQTEVIVVPVNSQGAPDLKFLAANLTENTALVSLMHVNNELGTVTDIPRASALIRRYAPRALYHVDGVQGFLKADTDGRWFDLYSVSAHKFHAPKGIGLLYKRRGIRFAGGQTGGGQEQNLRSGTLNVPGILGAAAAAEQYFANRIQWRQNMRACKERLYANMMTLPDVLLNGPSLEEGAPHILNLSFMGVRGAVLLNALSQQGVYVATGSACSSHKKGKNRILSASGIEGPRQEGAIRFSFCPFNTLEEVEAASDMIAQQVTFLRKYRRR